MPGGSTRLLAFLAAELAPTPGRLRATLRVVAACTVATALVLGLHVPDGQWTVITIFAVSQANAGASLSKAVLRAAGTLGGGAAGLAGVLLFADQPWILLPYLGAIGALGLFLSRTTTVPYAGLLGALTAIIVLSAVHGSDPGAAVAVGLWRIALVTLGDLIAVGAQLFLWPDDPEALLLDDVAQRLAAVEHLLCRYVGEPASPLSAAALAALVQDGLTRELDLLDNAEARYPSMRSRHAEQIALIAAVEHLVTTAAALRPPGAAQLAAPARQRVLAVARRCGRLRAALIARRLPASDAAGPDAPAEVGLATMPPPLRAALVDLERTLARLPETLKFLERDSRPQALAPELHSPLDTPAGGAILTPAFWAPSPEDLGFALKGGLAAMIASALVQGFAWPGLSTAVVTCIVLAQSSFGAEVQKSALRFGGALLGGLLGLLTITLVMPATDNPAVLLLAVAACTGVAAWLSVGSARIAYAGLQAGLAYALCVLAAIAPTVDLVPVRDRLLGILLGIAVATIVYTAIRPVLAGAVMRTALVEALRSLAALARVGLADGDVPRLPPARGFRWKVYRDLATTLRLRDESRFETGAASAERVAARAAVGRLVDDAQAVFLAVLALVRHRSNVDLGRTPAAARAPLHALGIATAAALDGVAAQVAGEAVQSTDLPALIARAEAMLAGTAGVAPGALTHLTARLALYRDLAPLVAHLDRDAAAALVEIPWQTREASATMRFAGAGRG